MRFFLNGEYYLLFAPLELLLENDLSFYFSFKVISYRVNIKYEMVKTTFRKYSRNDVGKN